MLESTSALEQDREAPSTLRIGQLARLASVHVETLRYYEREGLLDKPYQSLSGYRAYPVSAVVHVQSIKRAQALGFSLAEIRGLLKGAPREHFSKRASRKLAEVDRMLLELHQARAEIVRVIEYGCDGLVGCTCGRADCPTGIPDTVRVANDVSGAEQGPAAAKRPGLLAGAALAAGCAACCAPLVGAALAGLGGPVLAATEGVELGLGATAIAAVGFALNRLRRRSRALGPPRQTPQLRL